MIAIFVFVYLLPAVFLPVCSLAQQPAFLFGEHQIAAFQPQHDFVPGILDIIHLNDVFSYNFV